MQNQKKHGTYDSDSTGGKAGRKFKLVNVFTSVSSMLVLAIWMECNVGCELL